MAFIDQAELEAVKLSSRRAPCCNKHQFCAKMTVSTYISLFEQSGHNEERKKIRKMALLLPHTFVFSCLPCGFWPLKSLGDRKGTQTGSYTAFA